MRLPKVVAVVSPVFIVVILLSASLRWFCFPCEPDSARCVPQWRRPRGMGYLPGSAAKCKENKSWFLTDVSLDWFMVSRCECGERAAMTNELGGYLDENKQTPFFGPWVLA